jgi:hypothetical protein
MSYYFTPGRAFELLTGTICATGVLPQVYSKKYSNILSMLGLGLIAVCLLAYSGTLPFPGFAAIVPCLGVAMVIHAGSHQTTMSGAILSSKPFMFFGALSYSLYLWHWPFLAFARNWYGADLTLAQITAVDGLAIFVSFLSWRYVEQPLLDHKINSLPFLKLGAAAMIAGCGFAAVIFVGHGLPGRFPSRSLQLFAASNDFNPKRYKCHDDDGNMISYKENCTFGAPGVAPDTAVWGDSHGAELAVALGKRFEGEGRGVMEITSSACPPVLNYISNFRKSW